MLLHIKWVSITLVIEMQMSGYIKVMVKITQLSHASAQCCLWWQESFIHMTCHSMYVLEVFVCLL